MLSNSYAAAAAAGRPPAVLAINSFTGCVQKESTVNIACRRPRHTCRQGHTGSAEITSCRKKLSGAAVVKTWCGCMTGKLGRQATVPALLLLVQWDCGCWLQELLHGGKSRWDSVSCSATIQVTIAVPRRQMRRSPSQQRPGGYRGCPHSKPMPRRQAALLLKRCAFCCIIRMNFPQVCW